jgi:hypothetical protein
MAKQKEKRKSNSVIIDQHYLHKQCTNSNFWKKNQKLKENHSTKQKLFHQAP